jgi:hypothetical protein
MSEILFWMSLVSMLWFFNSAKESWRVFKGKRQAVDQKLVDAFDTFLKGDTMTLKVALKLSIFLQVFFIASKTAIVVTMWTCFNFSPILSTAIVVLWAIYMISYLLYSTADNWKFKQLIKEYTVDSKNFILQTVEEEFITSQKFIKYQAKYIDTFISALACVVFTTAYYGI